MVGKRIDGVVFDVDGTLTDSIEVYYDWFRQVTAHLGIPVKREDVLEPMALTGELSWDQAIPLQIPDRNQKIEQIKSLITGALNELLHRVQLLPGAVSVLKTLTKRDLRLGLVTSSSPAALRPLHVLSLTPYFQTMITREDGLPQKPDPAGILECTRRMAVKPQHTLTVGDSPLDIRAGKKAGTLTAGVLGGIASRTQLEAEGPNAIIEKVTGILCLLGLS
jgi:HAD superfamily hydrolase (TIGR01509 family)